MYTISPVSAVAHLDPTEDLLSGLFTHSVAPWLLELRFKHLPDQRHNPMTIPRIGYCPPAPNRKTRG